MSPGPKPEGGGASLHMSVVFFLGTGDMTKARLGIVRVVAHPAARMFA